MADKEYDVLVAGAGPAGSTAANLLAAKGYKVALVDRDKFPRPVYCGGWLNALATPLLAQLDVDTDSYSAQACSDITFHKEDFSESATPKCEQAPGSLIDRAAFDQRLVTAAKKQGVTMVLGSAVVGANFGESGVAVELADGRRIDAKQFILATGRGSALLERFRSGTASGGASLWSVQVESPLKKKDAPKTPRMGIVLGLERTASFGVLCVARDRVSVSVSWAGDREKAVPVLIQLCRRAHEKELVPLDLTRAASAVKSVATPASAALDVETHVGKHMLVIGEAGGFVTAVSNEGIYPSMWSAQIAADVLDAALQGTHSQEELMTFDSQWRIKMADYLRSPHTDIQFLLPLIFSKQPMVDRMCSAFFSGDNI
ncbi:MAG: NAD(P)/FAD-dependent oxidoreductase [Planctomycetes bacterium]|nr:NAD(P)/FAD-dependent oxidoreductase [Planctomycetota bacterium]